MGTSRSAVCLSVAAFIAGCGGGGSDTPSATPSVTTVPVASVLKALDSWTGRRFGQATLPNGVVLQGMIEQQARGPTDYRGTPVFEYRGTVEVWAQQNPTATTRTTLTAVYLAQSDGSLVASSGGGFYSLAQATSPVPATAAAPSSGPYRTLRLFTGNAAPIGWQTDTWSLAPAAEPNRALLCVRTTVSDAIAPAVNGSTETCAETNANGELLRLEAAISVPEFGLVRFR